MPPTLANGAENETEYESDQHADEHQESQGRSPGYPGNSQFKQAGAIEKT